MSSIDDEDELFERESVRYGDERMVLVEDENNLDINYKNTSETNYDERIIELHRRSCEFKEIRYKSKSFNESM